MDARAVVGEGPVWVGCERALYWVDIPARVIHRYDPATGGDEVLEAGTMVGSLAPRATGGLVAAVAEGFAAVDTSSGTLRLLAEVEAGDPATRMNDGKCDPCGRFWAGTMALDPLSRPAAGSLYRLDPDLTVRRVLSGLGISNGLAWSADGRRMYFIDSLACGVDTFEFDPSSGAVRNRSRLVHVGSLEGATVVPDGMTTDEEGFVWVAVWGGWAVRRYAPDGSLDAVVRLPVAQVSSCAFGGEDLQDLYVTSATEGLADAARAEQPHAGALFRCRPGVRGTPPHAFAG